MIEEYYRFLAAVDVYPYIKHADEFDEAIQDQYNEMYAKIRDALTLGGKNKVVNEIIDIIIRNSKRNVSDLNKKIVNLFKMEEEFKNSIMGQKTINRMPVTMTAIPMNCLSVKDSSKK